MPATLAELAARFGCELHGDADTVIETVGTLANAEGRSISFLANPLYKRHLAETRAAAVVLEERFLSECQTAALVSPHPYATYARIARFLHPRSPVEPGIHSTAVIDSDASVATTASIGAFAVVGAGTVVGEGVAIGDGAVIGARVRIGDGTRIYPRVVIMDDTQIGARCVFYAGAVIGSDGFGYARDDDGWVAIPQLGRVVIGDDVDVGVNTAIDRGAIEDTVIESGVKLDNLIQIGHNTRVGAHSVLSGMVGVAGSVRIGQRCMIGGAVLISGHLSICDDVFVTIHSTVLRSITEPGTYSSNFDTDRAERWRRNATRFRQLDERLRRVAKN